jgi:hypothetical protein
MMKNSKYYRSRIKMSQNFTRIHFIHYKGNILNVKTCILAVEAI